MGLAKGKRFSARFCVPPHEQPARKKRKWQPVSDGQPRSREAKRIRASRPKTDDAWRLAESSAEDEPLVFDMDTSWFADDRNNSHGNDLGYESDDEGDSND
jgi:hypothetical protein